MGKNKHFLWMGLFIGSLLGMSKAQNRYWIKFTDKTGTPHSITNPSTFLSNKAIIRRTNAGISIHNSDLPVNPTYIAQIENVPNVTVLYASKWLNGVVATITNTAALNTISSFGFVSSSNKVNRVKKQERNLQLTPLPENPVNRTHTAGFNYGSSLTQAQQLNLTCLHAAGFKGQGMTIAVLDNGFSNANLNPVFDSLRLQSGILGTYDFVNMESNVYNDGAHGAMVFSTLAGNSPGNLIGTAPYAQYWLFTTEDDNSETISEEYNWIRGAEFADSVGADILTTSLGYFTFDGGLNNHIKADLNGRIAPMSIAANMAARKGMVVLNAAGNSGGGITTIGVPADADSIIAVGAIDGNGNRAGFSSVGPSADGRIKPDLAAMGQGAIVCLTNGGFASANGTSFSCPILAGAVACFWQKNQSLNSFMVVNALKANASQNTNPDNLLGWGVPNMCAVVGLTEYDKLKNANFRLSPNPTNGKTQVELTQTFATETRVQVVNPLGSVIQTAVIKAGQTSVSLDLEFERSGLYFVNVTNPQLHYTLKLIKN